MKLVSINVEGERHLDTVLPFIERESPDVLCVQEMFESTMPLYSALGYPFFIYLPSSYIRNEVWGIALMSKTPIINSKTLYYRDTVPGLQHHKEDDTFNTIKNGLIFAEIITNGISYNIVTTHFTWTPQGAIANSEQHLDMSILLKTLKEYPPHILCGDFNIPRHHNPLYDKLKEYYTDNIPEQYASSLDRQLHKLGTNNNTKIIFDSYMVDYVWSNPPYSVSQARLQFGVSDHAGVVAKISKNL